MPDHDEPRLEHAADVSAQPSTTVIGDAFEERVAAVFDLVPGIRVSRRVRVRGKAVDIMLYMQGFLGSPETTIAVECKDYARRLSRQQLVELLADYWPLLNAGDVSQVFVVTRNGLVENATNTLDESRTRHLLYSDIANFVLNRNKLAHEMLAQYNSDGLSSYYQTPDSRSFDLEVALHHFDLYFSDFVRFELDALAEHGEPVSPVIEWTTGARRAASNLLERNLKRWKDENQKEASEVGQIDPTINHRILVDRTRRKDCDLLSLVQSWLQTESAIQLALLGTYGTGKSTFARHLAWWAGEQFLSGKSNRAPLLIELRRFSADQDVESLITNELVNRNGIEGATYARFQALNRDGHFLVILDGFDEMKHGMSLEALAHNFNEINRLSRGRAKVLIVGRPTIFASSAEQADFMQATPETPLENQVRYLCLEMRPLSLNKSKTLLVEYARHSADAKSGEIDQEMATAALRALGRSVELQALLSRPVHIPMFLRILPSLQLSELGNLQRSKLYLEFIRRTIHREMLRKREVSRRTVQQRLDFAARLACEMMRQGNARTISVSAIPDSLIDLYLMPGQSRESTRRELVSACFLEFKPPDILFFGHKSYCEFLVSLRVHRMLNDNETLYDDLEEIMSPESTEFLVGLCHGEDIDKMTSDLASYYPLLALIARGGVDSEQDGKKRLKVFKDVLGPPGCAQLQTRAQDADPRILIAFIKIYERRPSRAGSRDAWELINLFTEHPQKEVALAAIEALARTGSGGLTVGDGWDEDDREDDGR